MGDENYKDYAFSYRFEGAEWGFEIRARNAGEARERLKALAFAKYDGEIAMKIPAYAGAAVPMIVWFLNLWGWFRRANGSGV